MIVSYLGGEVYNAVKYYRMLQPLDGLEKLGHNTFMTEGKLARSEELGVMVNSDILMWWQPKHGSFWDYIEPLLNLKPTKDEDGQTIYPPAIVIDSDDYVDAVTPYNRAFATFGVRDWDGTELKPGDTVYMTVKGEKVPLWVDRKTVGGGEGSMVFNIERNRFNLLTHYELARAAHGVTVSTPQLAEVYRNHGCERVHVYYNSVNPADYVSRKLAPHEGIRIVWEGGANHIESWLPIKDAFIEVVNANPEVTAVIFGDIYPWMREVFPEDRIELHPWTDYNIYKMKRQMIAGDINLCPLSDHPFQLCKSAIRWYEGAMMQEPEVALAANLGPYTEIQDGVTGLTYNNPQEFKEKLTALIKNTELRKTLGEAGRKWIVDNRHYEKTAKDLSDFYGELKARQRQEALKP